jgi:hypothetical protein
MRVWTKIEVERRARQRARQVNLPVRLGGDVANLLPQRFPRRRKPGEKKEQDRNDPHGDSLEGNI